MNRKNFYICCEGGFGNRFNALVSGLVMAKAVGANPIIVWPSTNWCRSKFFSLFDNNLNIVDFNLSEFGKDLDAYEFIFHGNFLNFSTKITHPLDFDTLSSFVNYCKNSSKPNIAYYNDTIPTYISYSEAAIFIKELKFNKKIISLCDTFIKDNGLDDYYGVHLRATDFLSNFKPDIDRIFNEIKKNINKKYFVCSDDPALENKFKQLKNVYVYPKNSYVEKLIKNAEWNYMIEDVNGVQMPFNVERSDDSVQQAVIDLLLLARSNIIITSNSSFLNTAILIKKYGSVD